MESDCKSEAAGRDTVKNATIGRMYWHQAEAEGRRRQIREVKLPRKKGCGRDGVGTQSLQECPLVVKVTTSTTSTLHSIQLITNPDRPVYLLNILLST